MLKIKQPLNERLSDPLPSYTVDSSVKSKENSNSQIDTSEMREWTDEDWANSKRGQFYRPKLVSNS